MYARKLVQMSCLFSTPLVHIAESASLTDTGGAIAPPCSQACQFLLFRYTNYLKHRELAPPYGGSASATVLLAE